MNDYKAHRAKAKHLVYGVGTNDATYPIATCIAYKKWFSMIERCYSGREPAYVGVTVCAEWLLFSNFHIWMVKQDWEGKELDKDLIKMNNKVYAPDNCCFITRKLNSALRVYDSMNYTKTVSGRYNLKMRLGGKKINIGTFDTEKEATKAYKTKKGTHLLQLTDGLSPYLVSQLNKHVKEKYNV